MKRRCGIVLQALVLLAPAKLNLLAGVRDAGRRKGCLCRQKPHAVAIRGGRDRAHRGPGPVRSNSCRRHQCDPVMNSSEAVY
jgi:hypothetical protein